MTQPESLLSRNIILKIIDMKTKIMLLPKIWMTAVNTSRPPPQPSKLFSHSINGNNEWANKTARSQLPSRSTSLSTADRSQTSSGWPSHCCYCFHSRWGPSSLWTCRTSRGGDGSFWRALNNDSDDWWVFNIRMSWNFFKYDIRKAADVV